MMPELPEVEVMVRDLSGRIDGLTIVAVEVTWERMVIHPSRDAFVAGLVGKRFARVWRRGKYAAFTLDTGQLLIVHRGMTGSLLHRTSTAPDDRFVRLRIVLDDATELRLDDARKFGKLYLVDPEQEGDILPWTRMGPEPLSDALTPDLFRDRFRGRTAPVKTLLLNQQVLAGIGNIYADEALFAAGVHPARRAHTLTTDELDRLRMAVRSVLAGSIERRGTTFSTYRDLEGRRGGYQSCLAVFGRRDSACPRCGARVRKIVLGGRGTHFCPNCQR